MSIREGGISAATANATYVTQAQVSPRLVALGENGIGTGLSANSTSTAGTSEHMFTVGVAASGIAVDFIHWYTDATVKDIDPAGTITFNASVKLPSGTIYRLTFGGRTTGTLDPGGKITSDLLGVDVAVGDVVAVRTFLATGTAYAPRSTRSNAAYGGFTATTDLTAPGSTTIAASGGYTYGPSSLVGYPTGTAIPRSVLIIGDSIARGNGDGTSGADGGYIAAHPNTSGGGYLLRALVGHAGVLNVSRGSDKATWFAAADGRFRRLSLAARCTSAVIQYGINDVTSGRTAVQIQTDILTIATACRKIGIGKIYLTTITPVSTSTDGWATTANQTATANNAVRVTHNNWVRGGSPIDPTALTPVTVGTVGALLAGTVGHPITGFFEVADTVESSRDSGKWKIPNRVVTDAAQNSGSFALNSATAAFNAALNSAGGDVGSTVSLIGAGAAGALYVDWIDHLNSASQAAMTAAGAGTTVSAAQLCIGVKTIDGTHPSTDGHLLAAAAIDYTKL